MKHYPKWFLLLLLVFTTHASVAQTYKLQGVAKDTLGLKIPYFSIVVTATKTQNDILAYTNADENANYSLTIQKQINQDSVWVTFRQLSHVTKTIGIKQIGQTLNVTLFPKENQLSEVLVNAKRTLTVKGDTITYNVDGIKKEKDYTIEEVIDRIPGVTISENGQIKYKDKSISHFYINGVDLLEGRYNIATRGIPADAVKDIEVLTKHNHARIDKGVTDSDDVAFNLKIKEDRSLIFGSAKGDIGAPLVTAKAEVTPIYIIDKLQDIASLKANNIGESLASYGTSLTNTNADFSEIELEELNILRAPNTSGFGLTQKYWLDNESVSLTNDLLIKTKKDVIFKVGANYNSNNDRIERASNNIFFFGNDSTIVDRKAVDNLETKNYYAGFVYEINRDKVFLKNKLTINGKTADGISSIVQNTIPIDYSYNNSNLSVTDALEFKTNVWGNILNSGLLLEYAHNKENTATLPAVFQQEIPSTFQPLQTQQTVNAERFNIAGFSTYKFDIGATDWLFKQRLNFKSENLETDLKQLRNAEATNLQFPFTSDYKLTTFESLTSLSADYKWKDFNFSLKPELVFIDLNQNEFLDTTLSRSDSYLFFQPDITIGYKFNQSWNVSSGISYNSRVSRFSELFNGLILTDFSSLSRNPDFVNVTRSLSSNFYFGYNNILKGFYFSNNTSIDRSTSDFTFVTSIDNDGLVEVNAVNRPNQLASFRNTTNLTKRFFQILNTELSYTYTNTKSEQFFNNILQNNTNSSHTTILEVDMDNNTWYGFKYTGNLTYGISKVDEFTNTNTFFKQALELDFYTSIKSRINLGFESVYSSFSESSRSNNNSLFNASFYYKPNKKLFLRASLINIFNEDVFNSIFSNSNVINQSQFALRPRQFTIGLNYSL